MLAASNFPTPLFPIYAQRYHFGAATVTLLFSVYVAALIPAMLTLGRITDRVGRRPALIAGMAITAISSVAFAAAQNVGWLFAGEIIYGIAAGLVMSASMVAIRELHPKQHAGSGALAAMVAVAAGLTLGPLVSGVLATVSPAPTVAPFMLDIVLAVALALALLRIPETRPAAIADDPVRAPALQVPASIRRTWAATTLASAPGWMFMGWILGLSPSFLHEQLGIHISQPIVAGLFAGAVVFTNGLTQVILRRHHDKPGMLRLGVALIPAGLAIFALSAHTGGLAVALVGGMIGGVGGGIVQPNTMATIQAIAPDHARGGVTSAYLSVSYLALSIPVVARRPRRQRDRPRPRHRRQLVPRGHRSSSRPPAIAASSATTRQPDAGPRRLRDPRVHARVDRTGRVRSGLFAASGDTESAEALKPDSVIG